MTTTKMYDLEIEIKTADDIWLTQSADCGETATVSLHPLQIRHLAELAGLLEPSKLSNHPSALKKRLERIHGRLIDIHDDLAAVPVFPPGSGSSADDPGVNALWASITALEDLLDDYFPGEEAPAASESQGKPSATGTVLRPDELQLTTS